MTQPRIIQGGMGVAVSGWRLARSVSRLGQLGVVSGTALAVVLARRLQLGDADGELRRALSHFPVPRLAARVIEDYFVPGGKSASAAFKLTPMPNIRPRAAMEELTVVANFVEVFLAKDGHNGPVGINYLEKIQLPTLASLYGAILAGVDYVLVGAGIPRAIPGAIDLMCKGKSASLRLDVDGALPGEEFLSVFEPGPLWQGVPVPALKRPQVLGIVASATLALTLAKKASGKVDGFIVEGPTAGGHNAPPRGALQLTSSGEPVYGPRDIPELDKIRSLGLPFWLAGSYGRPGRLVEAIGLGATGIQVGTAFAFCEESGILPEVRRKMVEASLRQESRVFTDPQASPTGFPFKVAQVPETISEPGLYAGRQRICDLGYLRRLYRKADGTVGYRCPAEPIASFIAKGGSLTETLGRKCVCNGLSSTVGLAQNRPDVGLELPLVTAGDDLSCIDQFLKPGRDSYTAAEVIDLLLKGTV